MVIKKNLEKARITRAHHAAAQCKNCAASVAPPPLARRSARRSRRAISGDFGESHSEGPHLAFAYSSPNSTTHQWWQEIHLSIKIYQRSFVPCRLLTSRLIPNKNSLITRRKSPRSTVLGFLILLYRVIHVTWASSFFTSTNRRHLFFATSVEIENLQKESGISIKARRYPSQRKKRIKGPSALILPPS